MNPESEKYILENLGKKTIKELSKELDIRERKIKRFVEKQKKKGTVEKSVTGNERNFSDFGKKTKKYVVILSMVLLLLVGFAVYFNSISGEFLWDDIGLVKENNFITSWSYAKNFFMGNISTDKNILSRAYRPLQLITYSIDYHFWKLNPVGYHITNILLQILVSISVFWLITLLFKDYLLSIITSLLFLVHPIHTEAVCYVAGRSDMLGGLFLILSFVFYLKLDEKKRGIIKYIFWCSLMSLCYVGALLSREASIILIGVVFLFSYAFKKRTRIINVAPLFIVTAIYLAVRITLLKGMLSHDHITTTIMQRIPGFFVAFETYIRLLIVPVDLHMEYGNILFFINDIKAIFGFAIFAAMIFFAYVKRDRDRLVFFGIGWFLLVLLPVSNLYPINAYMAEHWLYLPSVGIFLIAANYLARFVRYKNFKYIALGCIAVFIVLYSVLTVKQTAYWTSPINFFKRTAKYVKNPARIYNELGILYYEQGDKKDALEMFKKSLEHNPGAQSVRDNYEKVSREVN